MNLSFYRADSSYCDFLRKSDPCVPYTMDTKQNRPFVGIVLQVGQFCYYAPLTSPKPKHIWMKNQVDFQKINGGCWGAINFNNMIPIHDVSLEKVNMQITGADSPEDCAYKRLLSNQLSWCNSNRVFLQNKAQNLYSIISSGRARPELTQRCCNFSADEMQYLAFYRERGVPVSVPTAEKGLDEVVSSAIAKATTTNNALHEQSVTIDLISQKE